MNAKSNCYVGYIPGVEIISIVPEEPYKKEERCDVVGCSTPPCWFATHQSTLAKKQWCDQHWKEMIATIEDERDE